MPITITPLPPNGIVGYGIPIRVQSDFIGPLPTGSTFRIIFSTDAEGDNIVYSEYTPVTGVGPYDLIPFTAETTGWQGPVAMPLQGTSVHVLAELSDGSSVIDTGATTGTWDPTTGIPYLLKTYQNAAPASFTATDRETLNATLAGIRVNVPALAGIGGVVARTLGDLFGGSIPPDLTHRHDSMLVSGQGAIALGTEPFRVDSLGFEWHWNTIPEAWGELIGDPDELERRVVQWRLIAQDNSGQLYQRDVIDSNFDGVRHVWGIDQPVTLEWYVTAGCVVELAFLVLFPG